MKKVNLQSNIEQNWSTHIFEFDTANLKEEPHLLGFIDKLVVQKESEKALGLIEKLSDEINLELILIPTGSFEMGADEDESESLSRERPKHEVTVEEFALGRYPVTQAQWREVASWDAIERRLKWSPSSFEGDDLPVECVSWHEAVEFCARLSKKTGRNYRLPTEAEWEYACRAATTTPFHFGETITTDLANYQGVDNKDYSNGNGNGSYGNGPSGEYREKITPVGYFQVANAFGLYDMHGNVWEWCQDDCHKNYENAPTDASAWLSASNMKVVRGGSWFDFPRNCRSAMRNGFNCDYSMINIGFRVAVDVGVNF